MMGEQRVQQDALFYQFSLERHVPETHLLRAIDRFIELNGFGVEAQSGNAARHVRSRYDFCDIAGIRFLPQTDGHRPFLRD
jgi:hypothetical protein